MLLHRRETHAAIAEHDGRHAMPARGRKQRIPHSLTVVMGVHVDPAGRHHQAIGVDLALGGPQLAADSGDLAVSDGDITAEGGLAGAVDDRAATNNDVVHANLPPGGRSLPRPRRKGNLGAVDAASLCQFFKDEKPKDGDACLVWAHAIPWDGDQASSAACAFADEMLPKEAYDARVE